MNQIVSEKSHDTANNQVKVVKKCGRPPKHPWRTLKIGESFYIEGRTIKNIRHYAWKRYRPLRFKCRKFEVNSLVIVKVTRVS